MGESERLLQYFGITGYMVEASIEVGSLYVRPKEIQSYLGRYAHRFVNFLDDPLYQFQHLGTATGIRYRGRFFIITTNHQREQGEIGNLGVLMPDNTVKTPRQMWTFTTDKNTECDDQIDLVVYEYKLQDYETPHTSSQFFPVFDTAGIGETIGPIAYNIGFPTRLQNVDYYNGNIDLLQTSNYIQLTQKNISENVSEFKTVSSNRYFEDGMSGSPLFEVYRADETFQVRWLGTVVRGGVRSNYGRAIDAAFILRQIDKMI